MRRVLTSLGIISGLLLTVASTGFVSGYQKAYAAVDFPTSNLGAKIRVDK
jgi:hypothetical protein